MCIVYKLILYLKMGRIRKFKMGNAFAQRKREREQNKLTQSSESGYETRRTYQDIIKENADFEKYYKAQKIIPDSEWDTFLDYIRRDLPTAFRITGCSKTEAKVLLEIIEGQLFKDLINADNAETEEQGQKPLCLPWYPNRLGWQLQITRKDIRRSENYFRLHNFLISETATGSISRQEVVSMIPPLLLDVKPHHKVIDMCAAPGSKTAQLIEMMHSEEGKMPEGVVVANDIDNSRCYMLVHQAKRLNSPCIVITNHDSACMPNITVTNKDGSKGILKYDRVLCDVPCTGDGTLRKNPDIWMKWNTANGDNLHGVQLRILSRGVELLSVGGRVVYSTCSLNPVENEAVIHRLLLNAEGAVKLVDVSDKLPGLVYSKGVSTWLPASRDVVMYEKYDDVPEKWNTQVRPQMFPPNPEDAAKFNLDRCIRILPHHQDTGGFFVAVLEKVSLLPWESSKSSVKVSDEDANKTREEVEEKPKPSSGPPERKRRKIQGYREDPFVFFGDEEPVWPSIREFFGINPSLQSSCLLTRCVTGKKKNIYFVSPVVRDIVINNQTKIKLINTGVKTFARCDNKAVGCCFRLAQEGLQSILPYIGECRRVRMTKSDLLTLLNNDDPKFPPETTLLNEETQERVSNITQGSCVLEYREEGGLKLDMVGWRGTRSLRAYVPSSDGVHFIRILGGDASKFDKNKFKKEGETVETKDTEEENVSVES